MCPWTTNVLDRREGTSGEVRRDPSDTADSQLILATINCAGSAKDLDTDRLLNDGCIDL